jgi:hypothetical protein
LPIATTSDPIEAVRVVKQADSNEATGLHRAQNPVALARFARIVWAQVMASWSEEEETARRFPFPAIAAIPAFPAE